MLPTAELPLAPLLLTPCLTHYTFTEVEGKPRLASTQGYQLLPDQVFHLSTPVLSVVHSQAGQAGSWAWAWLMARPIAPVLGQASTASLLLLPLLVLLLLLG